MKSSWFRLALVAQLGLTLAAPVAAQTLRTPPPSFVPPPIRWWKDVQFVKDLTLTADQSNRIDGLFQAALPNLSRKRDELNQQEAELSRLVEADAGEAPINKQLDRVEAVRAVLNKSRTLMIVHMREVLTPEQRTKFKTLREQWDRDHRPPSEPRGAEQRSERRGSGGR